MSTASGADTRAGDVRASPRHRLEPLAGDDLTRQTLMPADYVRHLIRELRCPDRIVSGTALSVDDLDNPDRQITVEQNLTCVANALRLADSPDWYLGWGERIGEHLHGPLTPAMLTAPTLGAGLDAFCAYFRVRIPWMRLASRPLGPWFEVELTPLFPVGDLLSLLVEIPLLILQRYVNTVCHHSLRGARIDLAYPPAPAGRDLGKWFECAVGFNARRNTLRIPSAWRETRNLGFNAPIWETALQQCAALASGLPRDVASDVRAHLQRCFAQPLPGVPTLDAVARSLHVSPRTLIRRLRAVGTTFHGELEATRRNRALLLLGTSDAPVAEIAGALGFADAAGFCKAFRRWTGTTPGRYRSSVDTAS